jgi:hypothetical protein
MYALWCMCACVVVCNAVRRRDTIHCNRHPASVRMCAWSYAFVFNLSECSCFCECFPCLYMHVCMLVTSIGTPFLISHVCLSERIQARCFHDHASYMCCMYFAYSCVSVVVVVHAYENACSCSYECICVCKDSRNLFTFLHVCVYLPSG